MALEGATYHCVEHFRESSTRHSDVPPVLDQYMRHTSSSDRAHRTMFAHLRVPRAYLAWVAILLFCFDKSGCLQYDTLQICAKQDLGLKRNC
eukprot:1190137-Prorocentrum_minimum.AAC.4